MYDVLLWSADAAGLEMKVLERVVFKKVSGVCVCVGGGQVWE